MSALVLLPPLGAPARSPRSSARRRHLSLVPTPRRAPRPAPAVRRAAPVVAPVPVAEAPVRAAVPCRPRRPVALRVTRRGRLALTVSVTVLLAAGAVLALSAGSRPVPAAAAPAVVAAAPAAEVPAEVVVLPGDTLWSIADEVAAPDEDVRDVVLRLKEANGLDSVALAVGDRILVPA
ncbi:LysM peptidoglycan-binding domain-containing protein [Pseudokineococcus marinus]